MPSVPAAGVAFQWGNGMFITTLECAVGASTLSNKEDRVEVVDDEKEWNPEKELQQEDKLVLTADEFRNPELCLITDPRLIVLLLTSIRIPRRYIALRLASLKNLSQNC